MRSRSNTQSLLPPYEILDPLLSLADFLSSLACYRQIPDMLCLDMFGFWMNSFTPTSCGLEQVSAAARSSGAGDTRKLVPAAEHDNAGALAPPSHLAPAYCQPAAPVIAC